MKLSRKIWLPFLILFTGYAVAVAQENLEVENVFRKYGMQEGAVLVELSTDVLSGNTSISFYKSLIVEENTEIENAIVKAIVQDISGGSKLVETIKNGRIESGYYCLKQVKQGKMNGYILYKNKSKKITLVYLEGKFPPQDLEAELNKLKDLFIYVNKKRIKLQ